MSDIPYWLPPCKNLDEVKEQHPNPEPNWVVYLEEESNDIESWVAIVENGKWEEYPMGYKKLYSLFSENNEER